MAKPDIIDREQLINQLWNARGKVALVAEHFGVSTKTIYNYADKYPTVKTALEDSQKHQWALLVDTAETKVQQAVLQGQRWAVLHVLNNTSEARARGWGAKQQTEIGGINGAPIAVDTVHSGRLELEQSVSPETVTGILGILTNIHAFAALEDTERVAENQEEASTLVS